MSDKAAIELGLRLHRLMENEDFAPFYAELVSRIANRNLQLEASATAVVCDPHVLSHIAQRKDELVSLREWIEDGIERGGREKMKQDAVAA